MSKEAAMRHTLLALTILMISFTYPGHHDDPKTGWRIERITSCGTGHSVSPQLSKDGKSLYFISSCDLAGENSDNNSEVFRWRGGKIKQLTETSLCQILDLALAGNDRTLAFASNCQFEGAALGSSLEIALMTPGKEPRTLTKGLGLPSRAPAFSPDGRRLAFQSRANLTLENPDMSQEIFLIETGKDEAEPLQLTKTGRDTECELPRIAGGAVFFRCKGDVPGAGPKKDDEVTVIVDGHTAGGNPDGNFEVFYSSFEGKVRQITDTAFCENGPPYPDPRGSRFVISSDCRMADVEKTETGQWMYVASPEFERPLPEFQVNPFAMAWSGNGKFLVVSSSRSKPPSNPERNAELFLLNMSEPSIPIIQVTEFERGGAISPAVSEDGRAVAFVSNANDDGENPEGNREIFLAEYVTPSAGATED